MSPIILQSKTPHNLKRGGLASLVEALRSNGLDAYSVPSEEEPGIRLVDEEGREIGGVKPATSLSKVVLWLLGPAVINQVVSHILEWMKNSIRKDQLPTPEVRVVIVVVEDDEIRVPTIVEIDASNTEAEAVSRPPNREEFERYTRKE